MFPLILLDMSPGIYTYSHEIIWFPDRQPTDISLVYYDFDGSINDIPPFFGVNLHFK